MKSQHSVCGGTAAVDELITRAARNGLPALALTDIENLSGQPRFHAACEAANIQPITGTELRGRAGRVVLLVQDAVGYGHLCRIVSAARAGASDPVAAIGGVTRGLFVLSDDPATLERLLVVGVVEPGDAGLLLVRPSARPESPLFAAAERLGVAVVADPEVVTLDPEDHDLLALLTAAIAKRRVVAELGAADLEPADRWFRSSADQLRLFADVPEAIAQTQRIAERCRFRLARGRPILPDADAFGGPPDIVLTQRCQRALTDARREGRWLDHAYTERLATELEVIAELGYAGYFLAAAEIAESARQRDIPMVARGSAVGSLVVHSLGLSPIDPIAHGLVFERFLHRGRVHPPDIDLDVGSDQRDELLRRVVERFGADRVAWVGTTPTFQFDSALRSGLAAEGASVEQIERFVAAIASSPRADNQPKQVPSAVLRELPKSLREALPQILRMIGKPRSVAMHPSGVVIADRAIAQLVPIEPGRAGLSVAQYDHSAIEQTGLTKIDLLGNRFLSQLERARSLGGRPPPRLNEYPLDDPATLARIDRAQTLGCFQIETPLLRSLLVQLPIRTLADCVVALALVRPGASVGAAKREYRRSLAEFDHGVRPPLYDEDLLAILSDNAGITLADADLLRVRIIASRSPRELAELERGYVAQARVHGHDLDRARAAWRRASQFAAYSFCKAHAWSHALLAYQSAYCKTHHLVEFGCALLDSYGGAYPLRTIAADLEREGVEIALPSVNRSALQSTLADGHGIQLGLARVKHLSRASAVAIVEARVRGGEFESVAALTRRVRLSSRELRSLILSGACDRLAELAEHAYPFAHLTLLGERPRAVATNADPQQLADYRALFRVRNELELLDMHVSAHPLRILRPEADRCGCVGAASILSTIEPGSTVRFVGLLASRRRHQTEHRSRIEFLTFEDETGLVDAVLSGPRSGLATRITTPGPYLVEGRLRDDHGHRHVELEAIAPFHERAR